MKTKDEISRRAFLEGALGLAMLPRERAPLLTAGQVLDRIKANVGVPWQAQTVDNLIIGAPDTRVQGIATTMMATLEVLRKAAASGKNLVITHESTFFSHQDRTEQLLQDPTYRYKLEFANRHEMAVFHFHDHWHRGKFDGVALGMMRELGWERYAGAGTSKRFTMPETSLARLAREMEAKLKIRTMRVVGDPGLRVRRVIASWGNVGQMQGIGLLATPDVDVLVVGETHEWELVEYAQDAIASGRKQALIVLGHVPSEQAGMKYCAEWLKGFISEVPIEFIAASEPFWRPGREGRGR